MKKEEASSSDFEFGLDDDRNGADSALGFSAFDRGQVDLV
jgi:hypothetical protein